MSETFIELSEEEFDNQYRLVTNHMNRSAGWVVGEGGGCLFETYGQELEFVKRQDRRRIWTLLDGDDGDMYVVSGFHFVNRVGYLLSRDPIPDNTSIQVHLPMETDD
jgi:hypothetical protein